jgi:hypothetical protein
MIILASAIGKCQGKDGTTRMRTRIHGLIIEAESEVRIQEEEGTGKRKKLEQSRARAC